MKIKRYFSLPYNPEKLAKALIYWDSGRLEKIRTIDNMKDYV